MARGQTLLITMSRGAGRPQGTLRALVFLGVLVGMVVPSPAGTRANGTLLASRGWGTLLSRSRAGLAGEIAGVNWESGYLVGIKRQRRLYCNVGIGFHLQVSPDGRISGTHEENPYSECEPQPVGEAGGWDSSRSLVPGCDEGWRGASPLGSPLAEPPAPARFASAGCVGRGLSILSHQLKEPL